MRNVWLVLLMVSIPVAPVRLAAQEKAQSDKEQLAHKELQALRDAVVEAINKNDLDRLATFLDDDVVVTWQNSEVCRGPKEVRAYYDRMMKGPDRVVESVAIDPKVDAPANLFGDNTAMAWGGSKDHFKLTDGRDFPVESRWSATVVRKDGQWKIASFHASVNMFDSPIMWIAVKKFMFWTGIGVGLAGLLLGFIIARLLQRKAPITP
jgi:uncharacterized protein (TIGR02246 family)